MTRRIVIPQLTDQDLIALALLWYRDAWGQLQDANPLPWLWVVAPEPYWAWEGKAGGPLLLELGRVLDRESTGRNRLREATVPVLLDSGAFSMIRDNGLWIRSAKEHVAAARRICAALGTVQYVATQDWMCEPEMVRKTGLSVEEHQDRTVRSYIELRDLAPELPLLPALQGHTEDDYLRCNDKYLRAGVDLSTLPLVGLGSVCRRSGTRELERIITGIVRRLRDVNLHGYGVKSDGALLSCLNLRSVDSGAWSSRGRWMENELRLALGLNLKARWPAVVAAMRERWEGIDLDLGDRFEWMRAHDLGVGNLQNSQVWAEEWRWVQQQRLAAEAVERSARYAEDHFPGQLKLWR